VGAPRLPARMEERIKTVAQVRTPSMAQVQRSVFRAGSAHSVATCHGCLRTFSLGRPRVGRLHTGAVAACGGTIPRLAVSRAPAAMAKRAAKRLAPVCRSAGARAPAQERQRHPFHSSAVLPVSAYARAVCSVLGLRCAIGCRLRSFVSAGGARCGAMAGFADGLRSPVRTRAAGLRHRPLPAGVGTAIRGGGAAAARCHRLGAQDIERASGQGWPRASASASACCGGGIPAVLAAAIANPIRAVVRWANRADRAPAFSDRHPGRHRPRLPSRRSCGPVWHPSASPPRLFASGATTKEIADLLGHRLVATTDRYTQADDLRALAQPWPR